MTYVYLHQPEPLDLLSSSTRRPWGILQGPALHREAQLRGHLAQQPAEAAVGQVLQRRSQGPRGQGRVGENMGYPLVNSAHDW